MSKHFNWSALLEMMVVMDFLTQFVFNNWKDYFVWLQLRSLKFFDKQSLRSYYFIKLNKKLPWYFQHFYMSCFYILSIQVGALPLFFHFPRFIYYYINKSYFFTKSHVFFNLSDGSLSLLNFYIFLQQRIEPHRNGITGSDI